jgi:hypothetical protein
MYIAYSNTTFNLQELRTLEWIINFWKLVAKISHIIQHLNNVTNETLKPRLLVSALSCHISHVYLDIDTTIHHVNLGSTYGQLDFVQ